MNYKEALLFIGKCLTINHEDHNKEIVKNVLEEGKVDWETIVKVSTEHYVFPALYLNLKRAGFLDFLPDDLVEYMQHINQLNRERNEQIIEQAKEINSLLKSNSIEPIFLKGTGNLLSGLYEDIAERMVGDIDFLVSMDDFNKTINIMKNDKYIPIEKYEDRTIFNNHYSKMVKENKIASIEIHYRLTPSKYEKYFNYNYVKPTLINSNGISFMSYKNKILMTCFNKQISDKGVLFKTISLRNSYDLFLLSIKEDSLQVIKEFKIYFKELNYFLASSNLVFNNTKIIPFKKDESSMKELQKVDFFISFPDKFRKYKKRILFYLLWKSRFKTVCYSFIDKDYRKFVINRTLRFLGFKSKF